MLTQWQINTMQRLWEKGECVSYIAKEIGASPTTVNKRLAKMGLKKVHTHGTARKDGKNRPYTKDTKFLVRKWHYENIHNKHMHPNKSIRSLANLLDRNEDDIRAIIEKQ